MTSSLKSIDGFNPLRFCAPCSSPEARYQRIADLAYLYASQRQFAPGGELDDWTAAEREVDMQIAMELAHPLE